VRIKYATPNANKISQRIRNRAAKTQNINQQLKNTKKNLITRNKKV
jgi:hypothetical protein